MRGRRLLREPCSPSLCAFCAHRFGAARQPSHVQRRFLQSSRSASTPPAAGTALKGDDRTDRTSHQRGPEVPSWGQPGPQTSGLAGGWGRSTIGNGIPSTGPVGSWGRLGGGGVPSVGGNAEVDRSSYTPRPVELTPDEQRARDLIMERQKRYVAIHGGPGPESSRAGRPVPITRDQKSDQKSITRVQRLDQRLNVAREALNRREMAQKRHMENGGTGFKIRRHMKGDFDNGDKAPSNTFGDNAWTGLKKRETVSPQQESPRDDFAEARLQREKESQMGRYIPLGDRPISESRYNPGDANRFRINRLPTSNMDSHRITEQGSQGISDRGILRPNSEITYPFQASEGEPTFADGSRRVQLNEPAEDGYRPAMEEGPAVQKDEPAYSRQPKLSSRFTANVEYNEMPKGRGRDKARRRQQFVEDEDVGDDYDNRARQKEIKKQRKLEKAAKKAAAPIPVLLPEYISVSNLAVALRVRFEDFVAKMEELGFEETTHDHVLNSENAGLIAMEYNFDPIIDRGESEDLVARPPAEDQSLLPQRPPVVTIMGHVDHGKTTLLDWLRKSSVAASEHGGITQHIGAFSVPMPGGKIITFLDTPGHAAFLSMRQRGANVTDIVILVVAADDSVKPQTIEAINHAKAAKVPVIVAINKIDKEDSNIDRVKQDLARHGVEIEDFGGDTQVVCVSGKTGQGMEELEEAAVTLSEILDMRAEQNGRAEGWVLEASIKAVGKVATVLVRRGTMRPGDFIVAGKTWARIRCLRNEAGVLVDQAGPGTPVEIDGWKEQPLAGDEVLQAPDEQKAKSVVEYRLEREERDKMAEDMEAINEIRKEVEEAREREKQDALTGDDEATTSASTTPGKTVGGPKQVYFIVKGDVSGSVEAVIDSINTVGNGEVQPHILRSGVGQINEFDIEHAAAAEGHVINFNTLVDENISAMAKASKVTIIDNNIIYRLIDDVKAKLSEHLAPLITQKVLGEAEIAQVFEITVKGRTTKAIAGCKVRNGVVGKNAKVRVLRGGEKVFEGHLASLKNQKKDVMEMRKGTECGIGFDNWFEFQVGDQVQSFEEREEKRYL